MVSKPTLNYIDNRPTPTQERFAMQISDLRRSERRKLLSLAVLFAVLALLLTTTVQIAAQSRTAAIVGTVTDSSGGVVAGAPVTVTNTQTREIRTTATNDVGEYTILDLLYGRYDVTVEKAGFKK